MPANRPARSPLLPRLVAAVLMIGFFVWILLQMAPHGPRDGTLLARLGVGIGVTVVAVAILLGAFSLRRRRSSHEGRPEQQA